MSSGRGLTFALLRAGNSDAPLAPEIKIPLADSGIDLPEGVISLLASAIHLRRIAAAFFLYAHCRGFISIWRSFLAMLYAFISLGLDFGFMFRYVEFSAEACRAMMVFMKEVYFFGYFRELAYLQFISLCMPGICQAIDAAHLCAAKSLAHAMFFAAGAGGAFTRVYFASGDDDMLARFC